MRLKWIRCEVDEEKKVAFSAAQEIWRDLEGCPGFLGQILLDISPLTEESTASGCF
ncbi:DUF4937 domain-containing protein [Parageobacillus thermoglucosidasius]|uniref:DUF4937 domain-containing protein n=1 Tax=Geobacillus sp. (strain Y4.1MC1) TaxID=581103 RepID=A0A7U3YF34_GEOS0|nr:DUF4937 domain-containing protein [Parageobacillus thermoglucosidasius]AEH47731.1 hypothetical protein Geoth_1762 [Parageobacillus thermoglucosidasius C56-YS93]RDE23566.1 DUF4937 domain-containing protein [Parageobacillus thermoglucosidasius]RDE25585.1 DUF4937 domain-containing protein [Parageobacillus thermoglucosidasius]